MTDAPRGRRGDQPKFVGFMRRVPAASPMRTARRSLTGAPHEPSDGAPSTRRVPAGPAAHHRRAVGADRLYRIRRPTRTHCVAPQPVRRTQTVVHADGLRGRDRGVQPVAGTGVNAARHLLRVARRGAARCDRRRRRVHCAGTRAHPRPCRAVPRGGSAHVGSRRRCRRGRGGGRGRGARGAAISFDRARPGPGRAADGCSTRCSVQHRPPRWDRGSCSCSSPAALPRSRSTPSAAPARSACTSHRSSPWSPRP